MQPGGDVLIGQTVGAEQNNAHAGHQAMGQRARTNHGFQLLALFRPQLQRGQGSSQAHRHLHSPQKMPKGKSSRNTYISYLRDTTLDVHKRTISYSLKDPSGRVCAEGSLPATRFHLDQWMKTLPQPWTAAVEVTVFTGWIYDHLRPHAAGLKVAHPLMLRAIAAAKKKNDRIDASKICDCLRCDFLPECYMAPTAIRERRRTLRYRNLLVRQMVQMKIKISMLLMEAGVTYNKQKLHKAGYFRELLASNPNIDSGLRSLLRQCRETVVRLGKMEAALIHSLQQDRLLAERVERLMSIPGIAPITALTWALEVGEVQRFSSIKKAISYCGLCGDQRSSADHTQRMPLSKQRNKH